MRGAAHVYSSLLRSTSTPGVLDRHELDRGLAPGAVIRVHEDEAAALHELSLSLARFHASSDDADLIASIAVLCQMVPERLRREVTGFRLRDAQPFLIVRGHKIDQARIGPTPPDWRNRPLHCSSLAEEMLLLLYSGLVGDPFGWRTQQDGHLIHDVFPIRQDEHAQLGTGSREPLTWHTEDAFHPFRADYVLLLAVRNYDRVATTVGSYEAGTLGADEVDVLFEERFYVQPDESHLAANNTSASYANVAFAEIERMRMKPAPVSVFAGDRSAPYLRLDPYFMRTQPGDTEAERALAALTREIDASLRDVVLEAGDIIILDNLRSVHGRRAFYARYDGTDRWLKRANVTRDLRKSRAMRTSTARWLIG